MIKKTILILILFMTVLSADKNITISINGDLDDDLFILKNTPSTTNFLDCHQMHNPTDTFLYDGKVIPSKKIYGKIAFKKSYTLDSNDILLVMSANEREEINPTRSLEKRTHFKSVDLFADKDVLIPSLMPEYHDSPNYPLWFGKDDAPCMAQTSEYNYYQLWENAIVNLGIIFGDTGSYTLHFINKSDKILFSKTILVTKNVQNIKLLGTHPLTEVDGTVFAGDSTNDKLIKKEAIDAIIIEKDDERRYIKLPYFFPYINRIYVKGL